MTNKFYSLVDGIRIRVASVMHRCCHRSDSVSFMSGQSLLPILLLCLTLFIGVGNVWGADPTKTTTFTSNSFSVDGWSKTSQTSIQGYNNNCIQVTWNSIKSKSLVLSNSSDFSGKIIKGVSLNYYSNGGSGSMQVKVAGNNFGSAQTLSGGSSGSHNNASVTGSASGTITITVTSSSTSNSLYIKSITVTYVNGVTATITLNNYSGSTTTSGYYAGDSFTLPSTNDFTCSTKTFVGWSTVEFSATDTKPTSNYYAKGSSVTLAASNTFYAVFADADEGEDASSITTFASGTYYLVDTYDNKYFAASGTGANVTGVDITSAVTANQDGTISIDASNNVITTAMQYTVTEGAETATVQNVSNSSYIGGNGSTSFSTASTNQWTVTKHSTAGRFTFVYSDRCILYKSGYNFRNYGTGNRNSSGYGQGYLFLVPAGGGTTYTNFATTCCTPLGSIKGSFF